MPQLVYCLMISLVICWSSFFSLFTSFYWFIHSFTSYLFFFVFNYGLRVHSCKRRARRWSKSRQFLATSSSLTSNWTSNLRIFAEICHFATAELKVYHLSFLLFIVKIHATLKGRLFFFFFFLLQVRDASHCPQKLEDPPVIKKNLFYAIAICILTIIFAGLSRYRFWDLCSAVVNDSL